MAPFPPARRSVTKPLSGTWWCGRASASQALSWIHGALVSTPVSLACSEPNMHWCKCAIRTPGIDASLTMGRNCHMKEPAGFSMLKNRPLRICLSAISCMHRASLLATAVSGQPKPSGLSSVLRRLTLANWSDRRALEKVRHGGAPWTQRASAPRIFVKSSSQPTLMTSYGPFARDRTSHRSPALACTLRDRPPAPLKSSRKAALPGAGRIPSRWLLSAAGAPSFHEVFGHSAFGCGCKQS